MGPLGFCRLEVGYSRTGKSVYFFVVGAFLLRVPCTFFFSAGARRVFFCCGCPALFCCGCAARCLIAAGARQVHSLTCCPPPPSIHCRKTTRVRGAFFLMRVRELTDSRAARRSEHPQQKKAPTAKKKNTGSQPHHTTVPMS